MRSASRRPTGDDTVRKMRAQAVPPAELTMTRARIRTDSHRWFWNQCQMITEKSYRGGAGANRDQLRACSACVGDPVAVEAGRDALRQLDDGLRLAGGVARVDDVQ